jgi:hypothetical protein
MGTYGRTTITQQNAKCKINTEKTKTKKSKSVKEIDQERTNNNSSSVAGNDSRGQRGDVECTVEAVQNEQLATCACDSDSLAVTDDDGAKHSADYNLAIGAAVDGDAVVGTDQIHLGAHAIVQIQRG